MFKRGICTVDDLLASRRAAARKHFRPNCYIGLYEEALAVNGAGADFWQEVILEPFAVNNAVFKRTAKNRFSDFDCRTVEVLCELPSRRTCVVHDMAVSDARTACGLFDQLAPKLGGALEFYATDLCLKVISVRRPGARLTLVVDPGGRILQIVFPPFVLPVSIDEPWLLYPVNRMARAILMRTAVKHLMSLMEKNQNAVERREILLLCREAREHLRQHPNFHVQAYDMLDRPWRKFDAVRAMNIFNRTYFPDAVLSAAIGNVFDSLNEDGVFVTGSNQNAGSAVNGSIYRKSGGRFIPLYKSALGSPVDDLVAAASTRWS
jgi:hypothetical protein